MEAHGLGGNDVLQGAALCAGEYGRIQKLGKHAQVAFGIFDVEGIFKIIAHHYQAASGATQGFVGGGGYDVAVGERVIEVFFGN